MNVIPVVDGKNINLYENGLRRTTIHDPGTVVGTPYASGDTIIAQVMVDGSAAPQTRQYDARTGQLITTLY